MATLIAPQGRRASTVVLHGTHPTRGYEVTWHITPLPVDSKGHANFFVERADGRVTDDTAWAAAEKETSVVSTDGVRELVRRAHRAR